MSVSFSRQPSRPLPPATGGRQQGGWGGPLRAIVRRGTDHLLTLDYALLTFSARKLPLPVGRAWAQWRGLVHAAFGYDWHSYGTGRYSIRSLVWQSLKHIEPGQPAWRRLVLLAGRYVHCSVAEWEGQAVDRLLAALPAGEADAAALSEEGRGTIYGQFHFGSHALGWAWLARRTGRPLHIMVSNVFLRHPGIHRSVRALYLRQYALLRRHLNGGAVLYVEDGIRPFYRLLSRGEDVAVMLDRTTRGRRATRVDFAGIPQVPFAPGTAHLVETTGARWAAFACDRQRGRHRLLFGANSEQTAEVRQIFKLHEELVGKWPQRWWASHILSL